MSLDNITAQEWKAIQTNWAKHIQAKLDAGYFITVMRGNKIVRITLKDGVETVEVIKELPNPRSPQIQWRGGE
jgi:hypothetical protein